MFSRLVLRGFFLAVLVAGAVSAQTINFQLFATVDGQSATVPNDFDLAFNTTVGTQETGTVRAIYVGNTQATITQLPQASQSLIGSTEFTITSTVMSVPLVLNPSDSFTFSIIFSPTSPNQAGAIISIPFTEPGPGGVPVKNAIQLNLLGTTPQFTLSYVLQNDNNQVAISSGGTIPFGPTQINATASANLDISNTGSGSGLITGITLPPAGSPFKVQGKPLLPATLSSQSAIQLVIGYTPTAVESDTGQIQITFQGGATETVNLTGSGITSAFTYKYLVPGMAATPVMPGGLITFPNANVATPGSTGATGTTSSLIVEVTNAGSASGTINSVSTNPPFTLTNPITLPATLTTGNSFSVPLTFTPTQVGPQTGQLLIGNDYFNLSGQGLGPDLTYAYTSNGVTTTVNPATGGSVVLSPVQVGQSETVTFTVTNMGSLPATISLVAPSVSNGPFTVSSIPLPATLKASQFLTFTITFTPTMPGIANGTLVIATSASTTQIPLAASASAPPALPSYTISGPSGTAQAATQSNISLTLSKAYPLDLTGTLTLTTEGSFGTDQAVQFETGGRTVTFSIPANSTAANFAGQGPELLLQTGTVAESVTLAPTFTTTAGLDVTPASPTTLQFTIPSEAPVLLTATAAGQSSNSFTLVLTGYSTTRSLSSLTVTFTPATGFTLGTTSLTIDISPASAAYYQGAASSGFGGLFQIAETFTLQGTAPTGQTLLERIASVAATVSNSTGTSNSLSSNVQ
jgi:hypothetical protein